MSVTYQVRRVDVLRAARPPAASTATTLRSAWRTWPAMSLARRSGRASSQPIWPLTKTRRARGAHAGGEAFRARPARRLHDRHASRLRLGRAQLEALQLAGLRARAARQRTRSRAGTCTARSAPSRSPGSSVTSACQSESRRRCYYARPLAAASRSTTNAFDDVCRGPRRGAATTAHSSTRGCSSGAASTSGPGDVVAGRDEHVVGARPGTRNSRPRPSAIRLSK